MFSVCTYAAETNEALNLVEGERVTILGEFSKIFWIYFSMIIIFFYAFKNDMILIGG